MIRMSLKSKVTVARPGSTSLRATVPEGIVAFLGLKEADSLEWKMEIEDGERVAIVRNLAIASELTVDGKLENYRKKV
jgi:bifunctional DNA-binding transcriptional regulator/antitoxin component of YhaV-PrlF toxin-antitoxin module